MFTYFHHQGKQAKCAKCLHVPPTWREEEKNEQFLPFQSCVPRGGKIDKNVSFSVLFLAGEKKEKKGQFHPFFHSCSQWAEGWKKNEHFLLFPVLFPVGKRRQKKSSFQSCSHVGRRRKKTNISSFSVLCSQGRKDR